MLHDGKNGRIQSGITGIARDRSKLGVARRQMAEAAALDAEDDEEDEPHFGTPKVGIIGAGWANAC